VTAASPVSHAQRTALITGAAGQDGQLLSARLLSQGYAVVGIVRPGTALPPGPPALRFVESDLREPGLFDRLLPVLRPDEIYHLAAFHRSAQEAGAGSDVLRWHRQMVDTNFGACSALAMALLESALPARLVFAASSQMYTPGEAVSLIDEDSPRRPSTFYGHAKAWSTALLGQLRAEHGLHASTAILFNHESSLRRPSFVSRKITLAAAAAAAGRPHPLRLMNVGARVDWSAAEDVVAALQTMAGAATPQDCVVASGRLHSVRELLAAAFGHVGLDWREHTQFDRDSAEPALCGKPRRLQALGWQPDLGFETWVGRMVDHDRQALQPG
jgi:GDPmannose 4,6-dehydratase